MYPLCIAVLVAAPPAPEAMDWTPEQLEIRIADELLLEGISLEALGNQVFVEATRAGGWTVSLRSEDAQIQHRPVADLPPGLDAAAAQLTAIVRDMLGRSQKAGTTPAHVELEFKERRKSPSAAFWLGFNPLPFGQGHLYAGEWWPRGASFAGAELLAIGAITAAVLLGNSRDGGQMEAPELTVTISAGVLLVAAKIWEGIDAKAIAREHNIQLLRSLEGR